MALTRACVIGGIVTLLAGRIFRDGVLAENATCLRSGLSDSSSCCAVLLEAILRSCLEGVVPNNATGGTSCNTTFHCGGRIALTWRSRKVVPRIQSTARLVTTRNGTRTINAPIQTSKGIYRSTFIAQFDASMSAGLRTGFIDCHHNSATHHTWMRFGPASEPSTGVMATINACF